MSSRTITCKKPQRAAVPPSLCHKRASKREESKAIDCFIGQLRAWPLLKGSTREKEKRVTKREKKRRKEAKPDAEADAGRQTIETKSVSQRH